MYDAQSRRIARREFAWNDYLGETTWHYVQGRAFCYDDWNLLQKRKPAIVPRTPHPYISQTNLALTGIDGPVAAAYVWGLDLSQSLHGVAGVGGLLETFLENTNTFYVHDANGNIVLQINDAGSVRELSKYAPYGRLLETNVHEHLFQFQTKCFEPITKTYDFGYRHYAPEYGRWLSRDPLEEMAGANRVAFVENNPVNVIDIVGRLSYRVIESQINEDDEFPLGPGGVRPYALTKLITNKLQYQVQKCGEDSVQIVYTPQTWIIHIRYRVAPETRVHGLYFKTVRDHEFYHVEIIKIYLQQFEETMTSFSKCECKQCMSKKLQTVVAYTKSIRLAMAAAHAKFDCDDYFGPSTPNNARGARCREARSLYESLRKANADYRNLQRDWLACKYGEKR